MDANQMVVIDIYLEVRIKMGRVAIDYLLIKGQTKEI